MRFGGHALRDTMASIATVCWLQGGAPPIARVEARLLSCVAPFSGTIVLKDPMRARWYEPARFPRVLLLLFALYVES